MALAAVAQYRQAAPVPGNSELRFTVVRDLAGLDALEDEWNALLARAAVSRIGFQTFAWTRSWAVRYVAPNLQLHVLLGYRGGRLALIWPLCERRTLGLIVLEYLGEPMAQYHDAIMDAAAPGPAMLDAALAHLLETPFDLMRLRRVREDSPLTQALLAAGATAPRTQRAPFVDLGRAEPLDAHLSPKARQNRRRRLRRLGETGEIVCEIAGTPAQAEAWIAAGLAFKREWALKVGCYAPAVFDPRFENCFRDAAWARDPHTSLRVFAMLRDGRPIGVDISLAYRDRLFAHVLAHDSTLAKYGLGSALADASIERAREQGFRTYDLLAPADAYKCGWTHGDIGVQDFHLVRSVGGAMFGAARMHLAQSMRGLAQHAAPLVFRALMWRAERKRLDSEKAPR
jgi:CelD/BcsL family acetyltransferase involved in cellulose biosynthesis